MIPTCDMYATGAETHGLLSEDRVCIIEVADLASPNGRIAIYQCGEWVDSNAAESTYIRNCESRQQDTITYPLVIACE